MSGLGVNTMRVSPSARRSAHALTMPLEVWGILFRYRALIWQLTRREVISRYRGSFVGVFWSIAQPIMMLAAYTFVFRFVFQARWNPEGESHSDFVLMLFAGLIVCAVFIECVNRAPSLILNHANYVKKIVFPLEILPWVSVGAALFHLGVGLIVLLTFQVLSHHSLNWTVVTLPLLIVPVTLYALGASWFLASVGVFVRDVGHAIGVVTNLMLFLAPVFYPLSSVPDPYRPLMYLNPLTFVVEQSRDILITGNLPSWYGLLAYCLSSVAVASFGLAWFERTRKGFADVL